MLFCLQHTLFRQTCLYNALPYIPEQDPVRKGRLFTSLQDRTVPAFQTKRRNLDQSIRPRLKDQADHSDRTGHTHKPESLVQIPVQRHPVQRIRKSRELPEPLYGRLQLSFIKFQPLNDSHRNLVLFRRREILLIFGKYFFLMLHEKLRDLHKSIVPLCRVRRRQKRRNLLHLKYFFFDVHDKKPPEPVLCCFTASVPCNFIPSVLCYTAASFSAPPLLPYAALTRMTSVCNNRLILL